MKKILLLIACMAVMTVKATDRLPLTGDAQFSFSSLNPLSVDFTDAWGDGVNLTSNIAAPFSAEDYPKCRIELDEITTSGSNMGLTIKYSDGTGDKALSTTAADGIYEYDLVGTAMNRILFRSRNGVQHAVIKKFVLIDKEGNEVETMLKVVNNATLASPAFQGIATFTANWKKVGGTEWAPTTDTGFSLYVVNFAEPVTSDVTFQFYTIGTSGNRNYTDITAGVSTFTYKTTNDNNTGVGFQSKAGTYPGSLNIASVTRYDSEESMTLTVNSTGISSFVTDIPLEVPSTVEVYYVKSENIGDEEVTLTRSWGNSSSPVRPGAYFVKGTTSDDVHMFTAWNVGQPEATNVLRGSTVLTGKATPGMTRYALSNKDGMLHPVAEGVEIPAGKAYLEVPTVAGARALKLVFGDETDGVENVNATEASDARFFNLQGQRVNANTKGIVINNGRKIFNK